MKKNVLRQVTATEKGVGLQVLDPNEGKFYTYNFTWREFERFVRKNGDSVSTSQLPGDVSKSVRTLMEMDD
jgi:hypothetical protein